MSYDRAKSIFLRASEMSSEARAAYVAEACGDDAALRRDVEDLLRHQERLGSFLDDAESDAAGTTIGPYKLLEEIGQGGFGVVYVAEQSEPVHRRVALKVIKAGMDTREVVARFEAERQALALMDHPNIARVFDGGATPGGRPYFVMELVKGIHIQAYCDRCHLPLRERLELFVRVCRAVQHAHQKGIIHRDLKPSNVLVAIQDGEPVPKVIDFGVAKATGQRLTEGTFQTRFAQMIGTPQYMSPEQAEMSALDVDTRSDVFSLGVLLYELLTGSTPLTRERVGSATFDELRRMIREEDPPTPSARLSSLNGDGTRIAAARRMDLKRLVRTVHGELDWIVMKALEKDRTRRYETTSALAADVERFLADEPVEAGPPSKWYRTRKFMRRHRTGVTVSALVVLLVGLAGGGAAWVVRDRNARRSTAAAGISQALDAARSWYATGRLAPARAALERAEGLVSGGAAPAGHVRRVRELQRDFAMVDRLEAARMARATIVDNRFDSLGVGVGYAEAFRWYGLDIATLDPGNAALLVARSGIRDDLIAALDDWIAIRTVGDAERRRLRDVVDRVDDDPWRKRLRAARAANDLESLRRLSAEPSAFAHSPATLNLLGNALAYTGDVPAAVVFLRRAQHRYPENIWINHSLGFHLSGTEEPRKVAAALGFFRAAAVARPESALVRYNVGISLQKIGDLEGAERELRKAANLQPDYFWAICELGSVLRELDGLEEAVATHRRAIRAEPDSPVGYYHLGRDLERRGEPGAAAAEYRNAIERIADAPMGAGLGDLFQQDGHLDLAREALEKALKLDANCVGASFALGMLCADEGDAKGAIRHLGAAAAGDPAALSPHDRKLHVLALANLGHRLTAMGEIERAEKAFHDALSLEPGNAVAETGIGVLLAGKGEFDKAVEAQRSAITHVAPNAADAEVANLHANLGHTLRLRGDLDDALYEFQCAIRIDEDCAWALAGMGFVCAARGEPEKALGFLNRAVELAPEEYLTRCDLGTLLSQLGRPTHGIPHLQAATASPDAATRVRAYTNLAVAFQMLGDAERYVSAIESAAKIDPEDPAVMANRGWIRFQRGEVEQGIALLRGAIGKFKDRKDRESRSGLAVAHLNLGHCFNQLGRYEQALVHHRASAHLDPGRGLVWLNLAIAQTELGDFGGAIEAYESAVRIPDTRAQGLGGLAWVLATCSDERFRNPGRAARAGELALAEDQSQAWIWNATGIAHYRNGDYEKALDRLRASMKRAGAETAWDLFFVAMAEWKLGRKEDAKRSYAKALAWMAEHPEEYRLPRYAKGLERSRREAATLLGIDGTGE